MDQAPKLKSWWQTLPGILTAVAALITAVTGLILALNQIGFISREGKQAAPVKDIATPSSEGTSQARAGRPLLEPGTSKTTAGFPAVLTVEAPETRANKLIYKILNAQIDRHSPGKLSLTFMVRLTNNDRYDANFWDSSFRLLVDGALRAPESGLNELVSSNSAKEGIVRFVIPDHVDEVGLQMGEVGEDAPSLTINLKAARSKKKD